MSFDDIANAALDVWFELGFAETVVYDNGEDQPFQVQAHVQSSSDSPNAIHSKLLVKKTDIPEPKYRDKVTISGSVWRVLKDEAQGAVLKDDGYTWEIPIVRDERRSLR